MKPVAFCTSLLLLLLLSCGPTQGPISALPELPTGSPFPGERGRQLDSLARADIWQREDQGFLAELVKVPRDSVVAFALYTQDHGVLKMSAQLYPLQAGEDSEVRLELKRGTQWQEVARAEVRYPGWSAHFRIENWDNTQDVAYRVRHGEEAQFGGMIRKDPTDKAEIVVASLSCNSNQDRGPRTNIVQNLLTHDPDLLFFAGDQSYDHQQHTAAWLLWGRQFREVLKDRPVVTIPDDHDIGQGNFWADSGKVAASTAGSDGGYFYPAEYIQMVERMQTWHLPDPVDPRPVLQGIGVYFTRLRVGGIDFAIVEDRKFKTGPQGNIPQMGPRPDHINDPSYDPATIDLPGLNLLGERQLAFLEDWGQDWEQAEMKAMLSQTALCGAVHFHGSQDDRLLADLDCGGWPQTGRNEALRLLRRAKGVHLCGDQHLSVVVQHGIDEFRDGPFGFTNPAIVNSYYGRWWWPASEQAGGGEVVGSALPWTGDYLDGLGNHLTMHAYANPDPISNRELREQQGREEINLGDGYGLIRFQKAERTITFEAWPRFADLSQGDQAQYPGWPITVQQTDNDGRPVVGYLPELDLSAHPGAVVQVLDETSRDILYTQRVQGDRFRPAVFSEGSFTVKVGEDRPDAWSRSGLTTNQTEVVAVNW
ncbi:MAG: hypothetical protein AAF399_18640 [Bacteroidota bacterium]